jgi:tetratricopeptide (TPR) repeat protein
LKLHPLRHRVLFPLLAVALFLGAAEGLLALAGVNPLLVEEDPFVGFSGRVDLFRAETSADGEIMLLTAPAKRGLFNMQRFPATKGPAGYRIFCLGGSTTYGRPYDHRTSFCGWLGAFLALVDPSGKFEVINAGGVSYASYRVAALMEELAGYAPDLFIVYSGHNEFLEERTYRDIAGRPVWQMRVVNILAGTRLYTAVAKVARTTGLALRPVEELPAEVREILGRTVGPESYQRDDTLRDRIVAHYRVNVERMIAIAESAGADILFVRPAANIKDESPFKSAYRAELVDAERRRHSGLLEASIALLGEGRHAEALARLDEALAIDDRHAESHYRRGRALLALGRFNEAAAALVRSRDEDIAPLRITSALDRALVDVTDARGAALVDFPGFIGADYQRRFGHAIPGSEWFLDHVHPTIEGHRALARMLFDRMVDRGAVRPGDSWNETAVAALIRERMATVDRGVQQQALLNLAKVIGWAGKLEEAHALLLRSLETFGPSEQTLSMLGHSSLRRGRTAEALDYYREAARLYPDSYSARLELAAELRGDADAEEAVTHYRAAVRLKPDELYPRRQLAEKLAVIGRHAEAMEQYRRVVALDPSRAGPRINLAVLLVEDGRLDEAEHQLQEALEQDPSQAYAWFARAVIAERRNDPRAAMAHYRRSVELAPRNAEAHNNLGILAAQAGRTDEAIGHFTRALEIEPDYADAERNLETARRHSGR